MTAQEVLLRNHYYATRSIFVMRILFIFAAVIGCILGYGYYHSKTHGTLHVQIDRQGSNANEPASFPDTEILFQDAEGNLLATGTSDTNYNFIHLMHPEIGDCRDAKRAASSSSDTRDRVGRDVSSFYQPGYLVSCQLSSVG